MEAHRESEETNNYYSDNAKVIFGLDQATYVFIQDYIKQNITSPSYEEMKVALDLKSKCTISAKLKQLEQRGWIEKMNGKNRSIRLVVK